MFFFFKSGFSDVESRLTAAPIHNSNTLFTSMNAHMLSVPNPPIPALQEPQGRFWWSGTVYKSDGSSCFLLYSFAQKAPHFIHTNLSAFARKPPKKGDKPLLPPLYAAQSQFTHPPALFRLFSGNTNVFAPFLPPSPPPSPLPLP